MESELKFSILKDLRYSTFLSTFEQGQLGNLVSHTSSNTLTKQSQGVGESQLKASWNFACAPNFCQNLNNKLLSKFFRFCLAMSLLSRYFMTARLSKANCIMYSVSDREINLSSESHLIPLDSAT
jgi:hypothetical protein